MPRAVGRHENCIQGQRAMCDPMAPHETQGTDRLFLGLLGSVADGRIAGRRFTILEAGPFDCRLDAQQEQQRHDTDFSSRARRHLWPEPELQPGTPVR